MAALAFLLTTLTSALRRPATLLIAVTLIGLTAATIVLEGGSNAAADFLTAASMALLVLGALFFLAHLALRRTLAVLLRRWRAR